MKIAAFQLTIPPIHSVEERKRHVNRMLSTIEKHYHESSGFDLVLVPELSSVGYSDEALRHLEHLMEPLDGETFQAVSQLAKKLSIVIVYGFPMIEEGRRYITQLVIDANGEYLCHYNKLHIAHFDASSEKDHFERGGHLCTFDWKDWRFGILICYDIRFPELARELCLQQGVDVLLHPVAFYKDNTYPSWHHFVMTRAMENQVYLLSLNQAGKNYGRSIFCPPWIDTDHSPIEFGEDESFEIFELDKREIDRVRNHYTYRSDKWNDYGLLPLSGLSENRQKKG